MEDYNEDDPKGKQASASGKKATKKSISKAIPESLKVEKPAATGKKTIKKAATKQAAKTRIETIAPEPVKLKKAGAKKSGAQTETSSKPKTIIKKQAKKTAEPLKQDEAVTNPTVEPQEVGSSLDEQTSVQSTTLSSDPNITDDATVAIEEPADKEKSVGFENEAQDESSENTPQSEVAGVPVAEEDPVADVQAFEEA